MLTSDRRDYVLRYAREVLDLFHEYLRVSSLPPVELADLFDHRRPQLFPSRAIEQFFNFALEHQLGRRTQGNVVHRRFVHLAHPKPPSWLIYQPPVPGVHNGVAFIGLNPQCIRVTAYRNEHRLVNLLSLHEIGHVFLHWDALFDGNARTYARYAAADHEAEAWCFAFAFVMFYAEDTARNYRNASPPEQATTNHVWELIAKLRV